MDKYGKKFEAKLKQDWFKTPGAHIYRLKDLMSGYKKIGNIADFVGYMYPYQFYIEAKTEQSNTLNFSRIRQYNDLKTTIGILFKTLATPKIIRRIMYIMIARIKNESLQN